MNLQFRKHKLLSHFNSYRQLNLGKFMLSGETHKWMYDSYSLGKLLSVNGFKDIQKMKCNFSQIENWEKYQLEIDKNGNEYKPHALYMEGIKQ